MTTITPEMFLAVVGLLTTLVGYIAGRNRWLTKTLRTITDAYEQLVTRLSGEIDRLHLRIVELEQTVRTLRPSPRPRARSGDPQGL
jgi:hypothetical protein